jgi:anthranilate synthase/aminodeoxychorismate synthase-like glutamine amidotransferase
LVIDNYDSFVYNLVQYLGQLGAQPIVHRNDAIDLGDVRALQPDGVLISPGPGRPEDAGLSLQLVSELAGRIPILGVCLGHQCIAQAFGGEVVRAPVLMHGKTSMVHHDGSGVLAGLADPFQATRYHSLVVSAESLPDSLVVTATSEDGTVMGVRHRELPVEGVQFHPESILTDDGHRLLATWLTACGQGPVTLPASVMSLTSSGPSSKSSMARSSTAE